ncbi:MAG: ion channel [Acidimicrobiales bacterium]
MQADLGVEAMLSLLSRLMSERHRRHAFSLIGGAIGCIIVGGVVFAAVDGVRVTTGLYWAVTTATTVGYGDVTPQNGPSRLVAVLVMVTTIPMLAGAFALLTGAFTISKLSQLLSTRGARMVPDNFRLVVGMHPSTPALLEELSRVKEAVVLVADVDPVTLPASVRHVRGAPTDAHSLTAAEPERAGSALVACADDGDTLVSVVMLRELAPRLPIAALAGSGPVVNALRDLGVDQVVSGERLVSHLLAKSLEAPHAGDLLLSLLDSERHRIVEEPVGAAHAGMTLSSMRGQRQELLLGAVTTGRVTLGIGEDPVLQATDTLLFGVSEGASARSGRSGAPRRSGAQERGERAAQSPST